MIPQIICVVGPTATGKTKMGVALARRFGGEVVSVDSMQIYRGMAIGTAAPTPGEMEGIPHHMVGVADPAESWSVARFVSEADVCVQDILRRGRRPILVGGTGLYLESLIRGTDFAAGSADGAPTSGIATDRPPAAIPSRRRGWWNPATPAFRRTDSAWSVPPGSHRVGCRSRST